MENISALMDSELSAQETHQAMLRLGDTPEAQDSWATYHLIGDVMRGQNAGINVVDRVSSALHNEPTILAPRRAAQPSRALTYALSAAASVSAVAVVGWMAFSTGSMAPTQGEIAKAGAGVPAVQVAVEPQLVSAPSDSQMNEYLLAHQGVSPSSGLQGVAPYIRTISIANPAGR
jgi:sigma-E factor negative regulatory protein RseA